MIQNSNVNFYFIEAYSTNIPVCSFLLFESHTLYIDSFIGKTESFKLSLLHIYFWKNSLTPNTNNTVPVIPSIVRFTFSFLKKFLIDVLERYKINTILLSKS